MLTLFESRGRHTCSIKMSVSSEDVLARQTHMKQKTLNQKEENQTSEGQRSKVEMDAPEDPKPIRQDNVEEEIEIEASLFLAFSESYVASSIIMKAFLQRSLRGITVLYNKLKTKQNIKCMMIKISGF